MKRLRLPVIRVRLSVIHFWINGTSNQTLVQYLRTQLLKIIITGLHLHYNSLNWSLVKFFKSFPGGSYIYWIYVTSITYKANIQSTNASHTLIHIEYTNHKSLVKFGCDSFSSLIINVFQLAWVGLLIRFSQSEKSTFGPFFVLAFWSDSVNFFPL